MEDETKKIEEALVTKAERVKIAQAMAEEMTTTLDYEPIGKMVDSDELPQGAYDRMLRDMYVGSTQPYGEWKAEWELRYDRGCEIRNRLHPIRFDKSFDLGHLNYVSAFKRDGEGWSCMDGNTDFHSGGEGYTTLEYVLSKVSPEQRAEIEAVGDLRDYENSDEDDCRAEYQRLYGDEKKN